MKRKIWIILALAALIAAVWCGTAGAAGMPAFTKQPQSGNIAWNGTYHVTWAANYTPESVVIQFKDDFKPFGDYYYFRTLENVEIGDDLLSAEIPYFDGIGDYPFRIRATFGSGDSEQTVYSDEFKILVKESTWPAFTKQPQSGIIAWNGTYHVTWAANYTPNDVRVQFKDDFKPFGDNYFFRILDNVEIGDNLLSAEIPYLDGIGDHPFRIMAIFGSGDNKQTVYSDEFHIQVKESTWPAFTKQPQSGKIAWNGTYHLTWAANYTPNDVRIQFKDNFKPFLDDYIFSTLQNIEIGDDLLSAEIPYFNGIGDHPFRIQAIFGSGDNERTVYSDEFYIQVDETINAEFSIQPAGGTVEPDETIPLIWKTSFTPSMIEIGYMDNGHFKSVLRKATNLTPYMNYRLPYALALETMCVRAWCNDVTYIMSSSFNIIAVPRQFHKIPGGGTAYSWKPLKLDWKTNFVPVKVEILYYTTRLGWTVTDTVTGGLAKSMSYDLTYEKAELSDQFGIRAYFGSDPRSGITSEPFTVAAANSFSCGAGVTAVYADGTLTISGTGAMIDYATALHIAPWYDIRSLITRVVIEEGVTSIGSYAFYNCNSLISVSIPFSISSINRCAFPSGVPLHTVAYQGLKSQWEALSIGTGNDVLKNTSITYYSKIVRNGGLIWGIDGEDNRLNIRINGANINVPEDGTSQWWAMYAPYIRRIDISGSGVRIRSIRIGANAFAGCTGVTEVHFSKLVGTVVSGAFADCTALEKIYYKGDRDLWEQVTIQTNNEPLTNGQAQLYLTVAEDDFGTDLHWLVDGDYVLTITYTGDGEGAAIPDFDNYTDTPWYEDYKDVVTSLRIEDGVTSIGKNTFRALPHLRTISIADTVTGIGNIAFASCTSLEDFTLPDSIETIGANAFMNCDYLEQIHLPDSITSLGAGAFRDCGNLEIIWLPAHLTTIPGNTFMDCPLLDYIDIPVSVTAINANAFLNCTGLFSSTGHVYYGGTSAQWKEISINATGNTPLVNCPNIHMTPEELRIDAVNFPDAAFRGVVADAFDTDHSGWLSDAEIAAVESFGTEDTDYTTVQGMEYFTELNFIMLDGAPSLTSIDLTSNTRLTHMDVCSNSLTELNIGGLTELRVLDCDTNQLTALDVSEFELTTLLCYANPMTSLSLDNQPALTNLKCYNTDLKTLDLRGCPLLLDCVFNGTRTVTDNYVEYKIDNTHMLRVDAATELIIPGMIAVDAAHFPDPTFRLWVTGSADRNSNGWLSDDEIANTLVIQCGATDIESLTGIEYFTALEELYCEDNHLTELNLDANTRLVYLDCSWNALTALSLEASPDLYHLDCTGNELTALDVSSLSLENLYCADNALTILNLGIQPVLKNLYCYGNPGIRTLDIRSAPKIQDAVINGTKSVPDRGDLYEGPMGGVLYVDASTELITSNGIPIDEAHFQDETFRDLIADNFDTNSTGWLTSAEIAAVTDICFEDHDFTTVQGIEYFTELQAICITGADSLMSIDLRANTKLTDIDLGRNGLTEINLDGLTAAEYLYLYDNALTALDVSGLTSLKEIQCDNNSLTGLDLSHNAMLENIECHRNPIDSLILGNKPVLFTVYCYGTNLSELDITGCPYLIEAYHGTKDTNHTDYDSYLASGCGLYVNKGMKIDAGDPEPTFFLPSSLTSIEAEAFSGIAAEAVFIPASVTSISGDPFAGSAVTHIYGLPGTAAETFVSRHAAYTFIPVTAEWVERH